MSDRIILSEEEEQEIANAMFLSQEPLKLDHIPPKQKKKIVVFRRIEKEFEEDKVYSEKEVNEILKGIHEDFVSMRRYMIEYGYLNRSKDGSEYWKRK